MFSHKQIFTSVISLDMSFCGLVTWKQDLSVIGSWKAPTDEEEPADWTPHMSPLYFLWTKQFSGVSYSNAFKGHKDIFLYYFLCFEFQKKYIFVEFRY